MPGPSNAFVFTAPVLPDNVVTFSCTNFGAYTPRGFDPTRIADRISGIPIKYLTEGEWLFSNNVGKSGSMFIFYDKDGVELGRVHMPSEGVTAPWNDPQGKHRTLKFIPTCVSNT